jgi:hypothetical protein
MVPDRLGKILNPYLARVGLLQRMEEQKVLDCWEAIVGKAVAEATQPFRVRNRVLQVKVTNSVWMHELQFHKEMIIQKLNDFLGRPVVRELWFFIGEKEGGKEIPSESGKGKGAGRSRELSPEEKGRIKREISHLRDREMQEIFLRVFSRGLISEKTRGKNSGEKD